MLIAQLIYILFSFNLAYLYTIFRNLIKEAFASSLCEKLLCIAELDRSPARELYKFYMTMSSDTTVALPPGHKELELRSMFPSNLSSTSSKGKSISARRRGSAEERRSMAHSKNAF